MNDKPAFVSEAYLGVLQHIALDPPSSNTLDPDLVKMIQEYLDRPEEKNAISVWNFYKKLLDMIVHTSGGNGFMLTLCDLERIMKAPEGAFSHEDESMDKAPWRQKL